MRKKYIISFLPVFGLLLLASGCALTATQNTNTNAATNQSADTSQAQGNTSQAAANTNTVAASSESKTVTNKTIGVSVTADNTIGYTVNDESPSDPSLASLSFDSVEMAVPAPENTMILEPLYSIRFSIDEGANVANINSPKTGEGEMVSFDSYQIPDTVMTGYRQFNFSKLAPSDYPTADIRFTFPVNGQVLAAEATISGLTKDSAEFNTAVKEIEKILNSMRIVEKNSATK